MHSTHSPWSYAVVTLPKALMALEEFLCWDQDLTGSFPAVVPGTDLPLPSLEVLPRCSWPSATFRLNHLKRSSFLVPQMPTSYYIFIREDESDRDNSLPRLSPSSWCVSFCCHIQEIVNAVPGRLPWDWSCGASMNICCTREDKLGWHHSSMWAWAAFKCLWHDLPASAFQCYCCFQELNRHSPSGSAQQGKSSPRALGIPQSPLCWFEMFHRKARDALLLSASLRSTSTGAGLTEGATLGGLDFCAHTEGASATSATPADQNYRGGWSVLWGLISASSYLTGKSFPKANTRHS